MIHVHSFSAIGPFRVLSARTSFFEVPGLLGVQENESATLKRNPYGKYHINHYKVDDSTIRLMTIPFFVEIIWRYMDSHMCDTPHSPHWHLQAIPTLTHG